METNMNVKKYPELEAKANALLEAARAFWIEHQKIGGPRAVVWLEDTSGHFLVFSRSEYRNQLLANISPITEELPLSGTFEAQA